jgi:hypothetical protein
MEQTALRPKPLPGQEPCGGTRPGPARRPHAARRRDRRLRTLVFALFIGTVLILSEHDRCLPGTDLMASSDLSISFNGYAMLTR